MASNNDDRAGGDTIPPPRRVNSLQSIMKLRPVIGAEWSTIAFVLNRDMIKPDGSLDELHAVVFPLGSFHDREEAEDHAKKVISITGHPGVVTARYGTPFPLTSKFNPENVVEVGVDTKGRLVELESAQYKREKEEYEKRVKIERDIMKEAEEESNIESIEHFKRQCYLAIKNRSTYQVHTREAETAWANYKKREAAVREHFARHPEHEASWLEYLKEKLTERGELDLYTGIETAYLELRDELLGLSNDTEQPNTDNINCECPGIVCSGFTDKTPDNPTPSVETSYTDKSEECDGGACMSTQPKECDGGVCMSIQPEECDGGVCMSTQPEECDGGVCMSTQSTDKIELSPTYPVEVVLSTDDTDDDMISPEDLNTDTGESPIVHSDPGIADNERQYVLAPAQTNTLTKRGKNKR